ncbi:AAC(3) family N-acetyltransferase [Sphingosinicella sp. LHD-64]|uniref:aminoglycoside N(3)-acetyltransferase n=1 Tax=Sphingosinicella sp. LHD-64 TaxID=3072139 RepID=UPI00280EA0D8|nr:AAC(3) family N-acetyltransferase [Sphingosinicella sp. LHD-64]MDQ8755975.1 AAC(3) family N-acetyltransferase [Sphingosinicella sp. LHD-64]
MTSKDLCDDLSRLGVRPGDLVMVHASLRRLGLARSACGEGGADLLLDALDAAVGPSGTLMMVLGSHYRMDWVNDRPVEERAALLAGSAPFVHETAPAMTDVGWLAEAFRQRAGTLLSANPSGRFGARGARAAELVADQPWNDYYGPDSPLEKLCAWGGRVLRLGADPETVTVLHYAEYLARLPDKRRTRWDYLIVGADGPRQVWVECLNDNAGIAPYDGDDYFAVIVRAYLALARHREGQVGQAGSELIDAADLVEFGARWMEENLA